MATAIPTNGSSNGDITSAALAAGEVIFTGTYHAARVEQIQWRDAKTGQRMSATVLRHTVLVGPDAISVGERVAEGADMSTYKSPFASGQRVMCSVRSLTLTRGVKQVEGGLKAV